MPGEFQPLHGIRRCRSGATSRLCLPPPACAHSLTLLWPPWPTLYFQAHASRFVLTAPFPGTPLSGYLRSLLPHLLLASTYWSLLRATSRNPFFLQRSPQSSCSSQWHFSSPDISHFTVGPCPSVGVLHEDTTVPPEPGIARLAHHAPSEYLLHE